MLCSQLCHLAAVTTAQRAERVVYFDTTNTFSAGKVKQMTEAADPQVQSAGTNGQVPRTQSTFLTETLHFSIWKSLSAVH
jgi:hypothetical protein